MTKNQTDIESLLDKLSRLQIEQTKVFEQIAELCSQQNNTSKQHEEDDANTGISFATDITSIHDSEPSLDSKYSTIRPFYNRHGTRNSTRKNNKFTHQLYTGETPQHITQESTSYYWKPAQNNAAPLDIFIQGTRVYITNHVTP